MAVFSAVWFGLFMLFVGINIERFLSQREVLRRCKDMLAMRHMAPGLAVVPMRVHPRYGTIERHWGAEEEPSRARLT